MVWLMLILGAAVLATLKKESYPSQGLLQKPPAAPLPMANLASAMAAIAKPPVTASPAASATSAAAGVRPLAAIEAAAVPSASGPVVVPPMTLGTLGVATPTAPTPAASIISGLNFSDPAALMAAANAARDNGFPESAKALASKAQDLGDIVQAVGTGSTVPIISPIHGVTDERWTKFANLFKGKVPDEISPAFHLGLFNIGFLRLRDLGLATEVKQAPYGGKVVWQGKFVPPMTVKSFLAQPAVQYKVFARDMKDRSDHIRNRYAHVLGETIEGQPVTLSGLLAAIKLAGARGFHSWVNDPAERRKFANTTAAYRTANGIF